MTIATVNPATGETLRSFEPHSRGDVERVLDRSMDGFAVNRRRPLEERAARMLRVAEILEQRAEEYGRLITLEMGKPIRAAIAEVRKCALVCRHYAGHAGAYLAPETIQTEAKQTLVRFDPIGPVLAVMPWNFPFWQVFRFAAPALMAGNTGVLKHASNVPQCALAIETIFRDAGFDSWEFCSLLIPASEVARILADDRITAATLTGSEAAGASVASAAASKIKKSVLELGGSDPFIVMPSADLDLAVATGVKARMINAGQSCIAAKRFIVHRDIAREFERRFVEAMKALIVGDPMDERTDIGPLAMPSILDDVEEQVEATLAAGAELLLGGERLEGRGYYYSPTAITAIPESAPVTVEETFGPVASLFRVASLEEAIVRANATSFGLGASAWTRDDQEIERFAADIEAGQVFINAMVASDPRVPFGGIKRSGFGRELGAYGIREFVNVKTVWIA
jgi:succinate-semialdehyde dehydrogenase/glutarate-semialdehyde dehydrogenase